MRGFNFDVSTLFSSLGNKNNAFSSINLSDYSSIKSGSYGKLLKSYYSEQKKSASADKSSDTDKTSSTKKKEQLVDSTGLSQLKKESDGLKSATEALDKEDLWKKTDGNYNIDKITSAVKSFANEYNDVISQSSKVTSKEVASNVKYMTSMTNTMSKALSKIGVSVGTDGKLTVNEDTLKKASGSDVKALFSGAASYGKQIADKAGDISKAAVSTSSLYSSNGSASSSLANIFNQWI